MSQQANPGAIKSIAIVGAGVTGWMVAAALSKGLQGLGINIVLVDDPDYREIDSYCEAWLPASSGFFDILGINEQEFVARTQANYTLATHMQSWASADQDYFMPYAGHGFMLNRIEFPHFVIHRYLQGQTLPYDVFSLNAVAARLGKFRATSSQANSLYSTLSYGVQINSKECAEYFKNFACRAGVTQIKTKIRQAEINSQDGSIAGLHLHPVADPMSFVFEGKLCADLYIDCTSSQSLLLGQLLKVDVQSAEHQLLANASACFVKPIDEAKQVCTRLKPAKYGWLAIAGTQSQQQVEYFFRSGTATCGQIMQELEPFGDIGKSLFFRDHQMGRREKFWHKNCIGIGESAFNIGSMVAGKSHLVQSAVLRLLSLFPGVTDSTCQQQEFNRLTHLELDHISDFHGLFYYLCGGQTSEFWQSVKAVSWSDRLLHKLAAFKQRGILPFYEGETFSSGIWISLLLGSDYWPLRYDPMVNNLDQEWIEQQLLKMQSLIDQAAKAMPGVAEYLGLLSNEVKKRSFSS